MQPISPEALKLVQDNAPSLLDRVLKARKRAQGTARKARLTLHLEDFADDAFTLYAALWYAVSEDVEVLVVPLRPQSA